jgi:hypothetical protein
MQSKKSAERRELCVNLGAGLVLVALVLVGLVLISIENLSGDVGEQQPVHHRNAVPPPPHQSFHDHTGAIRKLLFR